MDCVIEPGRSRNEPLLPPAGILAVNPADWGFLKEYARTHGFRRQSLFHAGLYCSDSIFLAGPAVGAPMAVLCLEKLVALGGRRIVLHGWCGALSEQLHLTDVVVPGWGLIEEGTSLHYGGLYTGGSGPDPVLRQLLMDGLTAEGFAPVQGPVWTTDAPYRETVVKVDRYRDAGVLAVDMEYSALCTVAAFRRIRLAGVLLVSDELWRRPWTPGFARKSFRRKGHALLMMLIDLLTAETMGHDEGERLR